MTKIDENDKLRAGTLGTDPFADAVPMPKTASDANEKAPELEADPFAGLAKAAAPNKIQDDGFACWGTQQACPEVSPSALHGLTGEVVRALEPHTEAHPMAVLGQFLVMLGAMLGRGAHFAVGATRHYLNLFAALVGPSAKARKGTAWDEVALILSSVDDTFMSRVINGLVSGEGLIELVRDAKYKDLPDKNGNLVRELVADGVDDKRLLVQESELGRTVGQLGKEFNTLSAVLRDAWDGRPLASRGRANPVESAAAHIGLIGHVTTFELLQRLNPNDAVNGFSNRFLWLFVKRQKYLPSGGALPATVRQAFVERLRGVLEFAHGVTLMKRDPAAEEYWARLYPVLTADQPGLLGSVTGRAEPMTMRLACLYALLDRSAVVRVEHLRAGMAVWKYSFESSKVVFGEGLPDAVAEDLARLLREAGPAGLTRTKIHEGFSRHQTRKVIAAGQLLVSAGLARIERHRTAGRPAEALVWVGAPPVIDQIAALLAEPAPDVATGAKEANEPAPAEPTVPAAPKGAYDLFAESGPQRASPRRAIEAKEPAATFTRFDRAPAASEGLREGEL